MDCSREVKFIKALVLPVYAVETIVQKNVSTVVAQKVASVSNIDPYIKLYRDSIINGNLIKLITIRSGSRRLGYRCNTCSCYCANSIGSIYGCTCNRRRRLGASNTKTLKVGSNNKNMEDERNLQTESIGSKNDILPGLGFYTASMYYKTVDLLQATNQCKEVLSNVQYQVFEMPIAGLFL